MYLHTRPPAFFGTNHTLTNTKYRNGLNAAPYMIIHLTRINSHIKSAMGRGKSAAHIIKTSHCYSTKQGNYRWHM